LPKGESFDARREKHGITVYYQDDDGKPRKQFYTLIAPEPKTNLTATAGAVVTPRATPPAAKNPATAAAVVDNRAEK
jgi:hypothetical protein